MSFVVSYVAVSIILRKLLLNEPWQVRLNFRIALHMRFCKWHAPRNSKRGEFTRTNAATPAKVVQFTYFAGSKPKLTSANNTGKTAVFNV